MPNKCKFVANVAENDSADIARIETPLGSTFFTFDDYTYRWSYICRRRA